MIVLYYYLTNVKEIKIIKTLFLLVDSNNFKTSYGHFVINVKRNITLNITIRFMEIVTDIFLIPTTI